MTEYDIEITFPGMSEEDVRLVGSKLPDHIEFEDRSRKGWGLSIRPYSDIGSVTQKIGEILNILEPLAEILPYEKMMVRLAIFSDSLNKTFQLSHTELTLFQRLGGTLEISIYPTDSD